MKKLTLAVMLLCAAGAGAQETDASDPKPGADAARHYPEIMQTMKNLALLMDRASEVPPEKLNALVPDIARLNAKVKETLGEKILAEVAAREKAIEDKARSEAALSALRSFRAALQVYYGVNGGKYPKNPSELATAGLTAVPELYLPNHERTTEITVIDSKKYDKDPSKAVKDTGGWLYFSAPGSDHYGLLLLDCSHVSPEGAAFSSY